MKKLAYISPVAAMTALPASADSIAGRMGMYEFTGVEYVEYYLKIWLNGFIDYPWVVRVSVLILLACVCSVLFLSVRLAADKIKDARKARFFKKVKKKYYESLLSVFEEKTPMDDFAIKERTGFEEKEGEKWKGWKMFLVGELFMDAKAEKYTMYLQENVKAAARVFGLQAFLENTMTFGSARNRINALRTAQFLMLDLPESILVRLLDSRNHTMRKEVRMYYLWLSDYSPFRFFNDEKVDYEYRPWDALEVHHLLRARRRAKKEIPSLVPVVNECANEPMKACLIREVAYWGTDEEIRNMERYLENPNSVYRLAAIRCMGIARCRETEDKLQEVYPEQPENLRVAICEAVTRIGSGKAVSFFVKCYNSCEVQQTKFNILKCLMTYNSQGRHEFESLEQKADSKDILIFQQVRAFADDNNNKKNIG